MDASDDGTERLVQYPFHPHDDRDPGPRRQHGMSAMIDGGNDLFLGRARYLFQDDGFQQLSLHVVIQVDEIALQLSRQSAVDIIPTHDKTLLTARVTLRKQRKQGCIPLFELSRHHPTDRLQTGRERF